MEGGNHYNAKTVDEIFKDFKGRRAALVKALTSEVDAFFQQCDPEKDNLCLYGHPNEQWEVNIPAEDVPTELPEPVLGINFARDGLKKRDWLAMVAVHCDVWLLGVAFYIGSRFGIHRPDRDRLFNMINELPTVFEVVSSAAKKKSNVSSNSSSKKQKSNSKVKQSKALQLKFGDDDDEDGLHEEEDENEETLCGACNESYSADEFWICCDICEKWYHGKCVKITPARAEHIKQYKCPICNSKRAARF